MMQPIPAGVVARNAAGVARALPILKQRFGERFSDQEGIRRQHAQQTSWLPAEAPDAVVYPLTTAEVAEVVRICGDHLVPVIAHGVGTSLEGHVNAPAGGVTVDLSRMDALVAVHAEDLDCVVQPGITRKRLNELLRDTGLFFPIDPGADASIGGMAATRASGTNAVRYGTMRDNVLSVTAVMANGAVIRTGQRARKSSAGYDLTRLLVGSEGTLGIMTEITLRLHGIPEEIAGGVVPFETVAGACNATIMAIQSGIPMARIELMDATMVRATNLHANLGLPETPTLFVEFHGSAESVREQSEAFAAIAASCGGGDYKWAVKPEERSRLWQARHDAYWASQKLRPGAGVITTDACVPISRLADCVTETIADIEATGLVAPIVGHVGDGNFHVTILADPDAAGERERIDAFVERLNYRAISMDGTCTGEHGVGQGKIKYLAREHGNGLEVMRAIKRGLDPKGILNPGKIVGPP